MLSFFEWSLIMTTERRLRLVNGPFMHAISPVERGGTGTALVEPGEFLIGNGTGPLDRTGQAMRFQDGLLHVQELSIAGNLTVDGLAVFAQEKEPVTYQPGAVLVGNAEGSITSASGLAWTDDALLTVDGSVHATTFHGDGSGLVNVDSRLVVQSAETDRTYALGLFEGNERSSVNLDAALTYEPRTGMLRSNVLVANAIVSMDASGLSNVPARSLTGVLSVSQGGTGVTSVANQELLVGTADGLLETTRGLYWDNQTSRLGVGTNMPTDEVHVRGTVRADHFKGSAAGLTGLSAKQLSGTISVACGGTGRTFLDSGKVLVGSGTENVESAEGLTWTSSQRTLDVCGTVRAEAFTGRVRSSDVLGTLSTDNIPSLDASIVSSGILPVVHGGTGRSFLESECVLVGNADGPLTVAQGVRIRDGQDVHARTFHGSGSGLFGVPGAKLSGVVPVPLGGTGRTTFPENAIVFGDGGCALKTSSSLYWDNATASLGVRNASPEAALDVSGTVRAEAFEGDGSKVTNVPMGSLAGILPVAAGGTGRSTLAANRLLVGSDEKCIASTSNLYWDNVGMRLGVRTASPEEALDVAGCIRTVDLKVANEIVSSASDLRLKQNVQRIERPWDLLDQITGYTFDWNAEAIDRMDPRHPKKDVGLIAQEIREVLPAAVYPCAFNSEYMTVKYEKLVPVLIECIKDLRRQMENKF